MVIRNEPKLISSLAEIEELIKIFEEKLGRPLEDDQELKTLLIQYQRDPRVQELLFSKKEGPKKSAA